jgi:spermidine synthase
MSVSAPSDHSASSRALPWMLLLFVGSGCAALIYEIVWFQLLQLVIGVSAVSLGVLLGTFMGGMCLGSLLLPRLVSPARHPLRVYAALELAIGALGLVILFGMPQIGLLYRAVGGHGTGAILMRCVVAAICLLPPTFLMGATLPAVARWVEATPRGVAWLGFFYGGNIVGAVVGCLLAGFVLLRLFDMAVATYVAVAINVAVGLLALGLAARVPRLAVFSESQPTAARGEHVSQTPPPVRSGAWTVYAAIGLSGLCALGAEVIWTRLLSLLLGGTVYTFSIILAVFLVGLGIGSSFGAVLAKNIAQPRLALGFCQLLLTAGIAWTAMQLAISLPYWPVDPTLAANPWLTFQLDLVRCFWGLLPPALLWGASFPLALAAAANDRAVSGPADSSRAAIDSGKLVGGIYAANTVGAILGALGFSVFIVGWIGTSDAQRLLVLLSLTSGLLVLVPALWASGSAESSTAGEPASGAQSRPLVPAVLALLGTFAAIAFARTIPPVPGELIAYGRNTPDVALRNNGSKLIFVGEGMNSSVAVTRLAGGIRNFHVSGKVEASSEAQDMRLQRMLGHIPALAHPNPKSVLVVGCGAGVTAGSFLRHPSVERVVICELEPLIPQVVAKHFGEENNHVVTDPRVEVIYDDARHYILTTREKFDIVTSDPINPWVKGAATLYTEEYFQLCRERLKPGGVITQWVPLYESSTEAVKSEVATFFKVFPHGSIWSNDVEGYGYDVVLLGHEEPLAIDVELLDARLHAADHDVVADSLVEVGFGSTWDLLATYAGQAADLAPWLADAQINRDRNLRLMYLAGLGMNAHTEGEIFDAIVAHRRFPEKLLVVHEDARPALKARLGFSLKEPRN